MNQTPLPIVAAFDFDCTISNHDTFVPFLFYVEGRWQGILKFIRLAPTFIRYLFAFLSRSETKERILAAFLKNRDIFSLKKIGEEFATKHLSKEIKPESLKKLKWHQEQGHRCILISAGLEIYLTPWAKKVGFNDVSATRLEITSLMQATGKIAGNNCWGQEKVNRLDSLLGPRSGYILYAYGDSRGDKELLAYADHSFYRVMN